MKIEHILPADIERRSMEIIESELGPIELPPDEKDIIKRVVHTSADFDYVRNLRFSEGAVTKALEALKGGCTIVTDTNMACMGISKPGLTKLGCQKVCFMADDDVAAAAREQGTTRAQASMDKAAGLTGPLIIAVGNAPTALLRLKELIDEDASRRPSSSAFPSASSMSNTPKTSSWKPASLISSLKDEKGAAPLPLLSATPSFIN